jgi:hypothetical protein
MNKIIYPHSPPMFDGPDPAGEARMSRMVAEINAFAALSPAEQQAQIATWPLEDQPQPLQKAA